MFLEVDIAGYKGFLGALEVKNPPAMQGSIPGSGRSPAEGNGYPLLENPMDRGAWQATVHGVTKESDMTKQLNTTTAGYKQTVTWTEGIANWRTWHL